jgi:hypothetical protein
MSDAECRMTADGRKALPARFEHLCDAGHRISVRVVTTRAGANPYTAKSRKEVRGYPGFDRTKAPGNLLTSSGEDELG